MSVITPHLQQSWTQVSSLLKIQDERDFRQIRALSERFGVSPSVFV